jgi:hypothetical protein
MAVDKPIKVRAANITSNDVTTFDNGLDERGAYAISHRSYSYGRNIMVDSLNNVTMRYGLKRWLPDVVGFNGEVSTVYYNGQTYFFVADDGRIKYIQLGDANWSECGTADTPSTLTTSLTGSNNDLVFTARQGGYNNGNLTRGANGDNVSIEYVDPSANDAELSVSVANDTEITVSLATDGGGSITSTAAQIKEAIEGHAEANKLVTVANAGGDDGSGVVTAMGKTNLSGGVSGTNWVTTDEGVMTTFLRTNDVLLVLNGEDNLRYIDLETMEMVVFTSINDPSNAPTASATGITGSGPFNVYYGVTFSSAGGGETACSPILTQAVSKSRSTWKSDGTEYLTISRNNTAPSGALSWNLYAAVALQGTTPQPSDLALIASNIPISTTSFVDNGSIPFDIARNTAPDTNSTAGITCKYGIGDSGLPILYGDPNNPYTLYIGGVVEDGVAFGSNNGGQRLILNQGTNYYPTSVVGFRNNQGVPNLLALFSNTEGISKQQIISEKTLTYGNAIINYWDADELNTGAASVTAPYAVVTYQTQLLFPSANGIVSINTQASLQNVLATKTVSRQVERTYASIRSDNFHKIVGTAWGDRIMYAVPSRGYDFNNQIIVYDIGNPDNPKWYIWDIQADWIGTISPQNENSFVYVRQGKSFYRLEQTYVAADDTAEGVGVPFPVAVEGSLLPNNEGRNSYFALNQAVFYIVDFIGKITVGVTYVTQKGKMKTKTKTIVGNQYRKDSFAGWGSPHVLYGVGKSTYQRWGDMVPVGNTGGVTKELKRIRLKLPNPLVNEVKFFVNTDLDNSAFILNSVSYEGVNIGVVGDIV